MRYTIVRELPSTLPRNHVFVKMRDTLLLCRVGRRPRSPPLFEQRLADIIAQGATYVVVQCSGLVYISSAGLRSVLVSGKKLQAQQGRLVFVALQDTVQEVFEISGFSSLFQTFASEEAALAQP